MHNNNWCWWSFRKKNADNAKRNWTVMEISNQRLLKVETITPTTNMHNVRFRCWAYKEQVCLWVHTKFFLYSKIGATFLSPLILWMATRLSPHAISLLILLLSLQSSPSHASDTLTANQRLSGNQKLISQDGNFVLGFFQPAGKPFY